MLILHRKTGLAALALCALAGAASAQSTAESSGMRVVRDPTTGRLRAPTAEEFKALQAQEAARQRAAGAQARAVRPSTATIVRGDGSAYARIDESTMPYSVVTRQADGSLAEHCVTGADAADRLVKSKAKNFAKNMKERGDELE